MKGSIMQKQFYSTNPIPDLGDYLKTFSHRFLTAKEAALYMGLSTAYFRLLARRKKFSQYSFSKFRFCYKKTDLDRYRQNQLLNKRTKYFDRYFINKLTKKG